MVYVGNGLYAYVVDMNVLRQALVLFGRLVITGYRFFQKNRLCIIDIICFRMVLNAHSNSMAAVPAYVAPKCTISVVP